MIAIEHDPTVKSMAVTAEGKVFSAGGDLKEFASLGDELPAIASGLVTDYHAATYRMNQFRNRSSPEFVVPQVVQVCRSCVHLTWWLLASPRSSRWDTPRQR